MLFINIYRYFKTKLMNLCLPRSDDPDIVRRELILNILICLSIVVFAIINAIRLIDIINNPQDRGLPLIYSLIILLFFVFLYFLSRYKKTKMASWLFIIIYTIPVIYCFWFWGADLPAALILFILIISLCAILINSCTALLCALAINIFLIFLTDLQLKGVIPLKNYWRSENHEVSDAIVYSLLIMIITGVILIFDKQIKRALNKLKTSEQALKKEKGMLEIKVNERTKAIQEMEADKISQLYRLAEFGRISSGIFHDLINPLTAISLNLEQINSQEDVRIGRTKECLVRAIRASSKMADLVGSIKKSIKQENVKKIFSFFTECQNTLKLLGYQARQANTEINLYGDKKVSLNGDCLKFNQIITNLVSNSIDACKSKATNIQTKIKLKIKRNKNLAIIKVTDNGVGIEPQIINRIFEPFFTTKDKRGLGLGLSSTKAIVEKDFKGNIKVYCNEYKQTVFVVKIPLLK